MIGPTDITAIFGQRGSGKTDMGKALSRLYRRLFVIDVVKDWDRKKDGLELVTDDFEVAADFLEEKIGSPEWRACFRFSVDTSSDHQKKVFNAILRTLYMRGEITGENVCLLIEEVHMYCSPSTIEEWLFKVITLGRHANIPMIMSSQRPAQVHKSITSAASHKFIGQLDDARDLKYFGEISAELPAEIQGLKKYDFIYRAQGEAPRTVNRESF